MSTENLEPDSNGDSDDVAGHFQLPPETFDDDAPRPKAPRDGTRSRIADEADDEDDVAGHIRTYPKAVENGGEDSDDVDGHGRGRI